MALSRQRLVEVMNYDPETGVFAWKVSTSNRIKVGARAGYILNIGYVFICIDGTRYLAHRLAYLYMTGEFPLLEIDHINGNRADNRWLNLRLATSRQNKGNMKCRSDNVSGLKGVQFHKQTQKWRARIRVFGKSKSLGLYENAADAHHAYCKAAKVYFGEFARIS